MTGASLLATIAASEDRRPFALLHRPESGVGEQLELLFGEFAEVSGTAELPAPEICRPDAYELLTVLPFRLIGERGYVHHDDGEPVLAMSITEQHLVPVGEALAQFADWPIEVTGGRFDLDDNTYGEIVRRVVAEEIGHGSGSNFVIKRALRSEITNWSPRTALALFSRLLAMEPSAYWTFLIDSGDRTFIGASPERHVSLSAGTVVMNPISGTYRYPSAGPTLTGALDFLANSKEINELYMVLDEELKMMSGICEHGVRVLGPQLKEMAHVAHTEYLIEGHSTRDFRDVLRGTLFAPTVTGSPLESACRVITRFEPAGRGYYAGVAALVGADGCGDRWMDSAIMIRTADINSAGQISIGVGSTLVCDSDPAAEAAETTAKAAGLLAALHSTASRVTPARRRPRLGEHPQVRATLSARNAPLSDFWLGTAGATARGSVHTGCKLLIIDAEDTFTAMGSQMLAALGFQVTVRRFDQPYLIDGCDLIVVGPGPGDPRDVRHPRIAYLRQTTRTLLEREVPFLSVCLSHQLLSSLLGLQLVRRDIPNQGVRKRIDLFGHDESVYFYNTFAAYSDVDLVDSPRGGTVEVCRDRITGEVHALRGDGFASVQFHPASVMTRNGLSVLDRLVTELCRRHHTRPDRDTVEINSASRGLPRPDWSGRHSARCGSIQARPA